MPRFSRSSAVHMYPMTAAMMTIDSMPSMFVTPRVCLCCCCPCLRAAAPRVVVHPPSPNTQHNPCTPPLRHHLTLWGWLRCDGARAYTICLARILPFAVPLPVIDAYVCLDHAPEELSCILSILECVCS
jgi:hypothetical protein